MNVEAAATAFGLPVRLHLIRFYLQHPASTQAAAMESLGIGRRPVQVNTRILVDAGVLIEQPSSDKRQRSYQVDRDRVEDLLAAARDFTLGID